MRTIPYTPPPRIPGQGGRWLARDKEAVVAEIVAGTRTAEQAMAHYGISEEELLSWAQRLRRYGRGGLKSTRLQVSPL